jgi:alanine dehydrogenase
LLSGTAADAVHPAPILEAIAMVIGVPKEIHRHEHRVGLSPFAVHQLVTEGHEIFVEQGAGLAAHFSDQDFERAGAQIVYGRREPYHRADLVCRVGRPSTEELELLKPGGVIIAFQHLAVIPKANVERFMELGTTLIGYEVIRNRHGRSPVLNPLSEMAGHMAIPLAAHYLQAEKGGRGILIGNVPGVPPATVLVLGAGAVGATAARSALHDGAHVVMMDHDMDRLRRVSRELEGRVVTLLATEERLHRHTRIADVIIGAILIPGERAPFLLTEQMVKNMKPGSVILDISIDQGGCVETSRLTTLDRPTFVQHDVIHYCVPNMTANVPRTASRVLATAALPYVESLATKGVKQALRDDPGLAAGVFTFEGQLVHQGIGEHYDLPVKNLNDLLG